MKWHEIEDTYGTPIAFTYPTWKSGDYMVIRSRGNVELWRDGRECTVMENISIFCSLYFHWYENDKWLPLFGFY